MVLCHRMPVEVIEIRGFELCVMELFGFDLALFVMSGSGMFMFNGHFY